ncbi:hypothetical protein AMJ39_09055 [candidate division TA06 bacterium DG_24]|uniref:Uncharacterized protein n=2 Tax=Bacteria division TA06 TaxID=1156500 RepID=A0A0S7WP23_UNCT6|nr:MAG: hypothetical protein AMJ39_09055 [candidate division TA06 bacterium DG_24]
MSQPMGVARQCSWAYIIYPVGAACIVGVALVMSVAWVVHIARAMGVAQVVSVALTLGVARVTSAPRVMSAACVKGEAWVVVTACARCLRRGRNVRTLAPCVMAAVYVMA